MPDDGGSGGVPWNRFKTIIDVPAHWIGAQRVELHLVSGPDTRSISEFDNVVLVPIVPEPAPPFPAPNCGGDLVANGNF